MELARAARAVEIVRPLLVCTVDRLEHMRFLVRWVFQLVQKETRELVACPTRTISTFLSGFERYIYNGRQPQIGKKSVWGWLECRQGWTVDNAITVLFKVLLQDVIYTFGRPDVSDGTRTDGTVRCIFFLPCHREAANESCSWYCYCSLYYFLWAATVFSV